MIQDILTAITISGASGYAIYSFVKILINAKQKKSNCNGCSGCSPKQHVYKLDKNILVKR